MNTNRELLRRRGEELSLICMSELSAGELRTYVRTAECAHKNDPAWKRPQKSRRVSCSDYLRYLKIGKAKKSQRKKRRIGEKCLSYEDCYTNNCKNQVCKPKSKSPPPLLYARPSINNYLPGSLSDDVKSNLAWSRNVAVKEKKIKIRTSSGMLKHLAWNSPELEQILLRNFRTKRKVDCKKIAGPSQYLSNCWFNTFFMCYFISDSGRTFYKSLAYTMITGKFPERRGGKVVGGKEVAKVFRYPMILLASLIDSCLQGKIRNQDTQTIVEAFRLANIGQPKCWNCHVVPEDGTAWSPITFYTTLVVILGVNNELVWTVPCEAIMKGGKLDINNLPIYRGMYPHHLQVQYWSGSAQLLRRKLKNTVKFGNVKYNLDSIIVRDTTKKHFCCLISCHGHGYRYDGASRVKVKSYTWKSKEFTFESGGLTFSYFDSYQILNYYRAS